ncbi:MAG: ABC transporter permease subunit [Bdellovibrionales bacterium]|nr:ABC transporter permease subunit [Bdellovibrionales bacterium]
MRALWSIAWKDFRTLVTSPIFFLTTAICTAIWSFNFLRAVSRFSQMSSMPPQFRQGQSLNIHYHLFVDHISLINLIFIFAIPAITMRLISEEKKSGTYGLLLTSPITATSIAVGKFLAGFLVSLVLIGVAFLYPLGTRAFTEFSMGPLFASFLGVCLMTATYVAVGLFASSLSQSQVLSVILGILFNLILWLMSQGSQMSDNEVLSAIFEYIHVPQQFFSFIKGTISTSALFFFFISIGFFVFLTQRVVESSRWR